MAESWWLDKLNPDLSQGDVVADLLFTTPVVPETSVVKGTGKGGREVWTPDVTFKSGKDGRVSTLATGRIAHALVMSHHCELDKDPKNGRVIVVPMLPLSAFGGDRVEEIQSQKLLAIMPVPGIPGLGDYGADMRLVTSLPRQLVNGHQRVSSMTEDAILRFRAQIMGFYLRVNWSET